MADGKRGVDVIAVTTADWDHPVWTNKQRLASGLAPRHRVLYVESVGLRTPSLAYRDWARMARRLGHAVRGVTQVAPGLWVLSPLLVPRYQSGTVRSGNGWALARQVAHAARALGFERPVLWTFAAIDPRILVAARASACILHVVDDLGAVPGVSPRALETMEVRLLPHVDVVLASSRPLFRRWAGRHPNVRYWPNVAEVERFQPVAQGRVAPDPLLRHLPRPRACYVGAIDGYKVDLGLLAAAVRQRPDWHWVMAGPVGLGHPATRRHLPRAPNLHWLGPVPESRVPALLAGCDAALLPHRTNGYTAASEPIKLREYQAAGLPIVTSLAHWAGEPGVMAAPDATAFARALDQARSLHTAGFRLALSEYAGRYSWERRIAEAEVLLDAYSAPRA